ncbi:uncharacterized protein LOC111868412 [Cryptotermes secundus]|uniref:uncharacterized protein LOC111868412 n=1 Tax=Cryptotermes secundus TaxID=105785 RepID=UPI001454C305|nr:uncharacterized protein LOC111868412 [Cryptotermes secundus]
MSTSLASEQDNQNGKENERSKRASRLDYCNEDQLLSHLTELQALNPESIVNLATRQGVKCVCRKVSESLKTLDKYIKTCKPTYVEDSYMSLITGIRTTHGKLCKDRDFRKEFRKYSSCYRDIKEEYNNCAGPEDWMDNSRKKCVCNTYQTLDDCYYNVTVRPCGKNAASNMKEFAGCVIGSVMMIKCSNVSHKDGLQNIPQEKDSTEIPSDSNDSKKYYLAGYIVAGIVATIMLIFISYCCIKRWRSSRVRFYETVREPLLRDTTE